MVQLKATSANGCSNWDVKRHYVRVLPDITTDMNELRLTNNGIQIMPNPTRDEAIIYVQDLKERTDLNIEICNYSGQLIQKITETNVVSSKLNTTNYSSGIYFIKVKCNDKIYNAKLIVQH